MTYQFIAIDPGTGKCGVAVLNSAGATLEKHVFPAAELKQELEKLLEKYPAADRVALGDGTGHAKVKELLLSLPRKLEVHIINEKNTTMKARIIYRKENALPGPLSWIPPDLFKPAKDIDAYAAVAIGLQYLENTNGKT